MMSLITATYILILVMISTANAKEDSKTQKAEYKDLGEHTMVSDSETFPYVAAILKKTTYMCAGALIDDRWVITSGDSLFLLRDSSRIIRVRLGSINHKKGGVLTPIKYFQIHPYFDDNKPQYDIALIRLSQPVRLTPNLNPVRLQPRPKEVAATHFIVTGWQTWPKDTPAEDNRFLESLDSIRRHRLLTVSHLHPTYPEECSEQLSMSDLNDTDNTLMCLDPAVGTDPCERQAGAPVVLNGVLWGIVSSWREEDCDLVSGPTYVVLVAADNISSWVRATLQDKTWKPKPRVYHLDDKMNISYVINNQL